MLRCKLNIIRWDLVIFLVMQKCHRVTCEDNEDCVNCKTSKKNGCDAGFYGYKCQYVDLAFSAIVNHEELVDGDDKTCLTLNMAMTIINLDSFYAVSTFRIKSPDTDKLKEVHIEFVSPDGQHRVMCKNIRILMRYSDEYEINCDTNEAVKIIHILWLAPIYVCSVYVSGGRHLLSYFKLYKEESNSYSTFKVRSLITSRALHNSTKTSTTTTEADTTQQLVDTETTSQVISTQNTSLLQEAEYENVTLAAGPTLESNESLGQQSERQLQKREPVSRCDPLDPETSLYLNLSFNAVYTIFRFQVGGIGQQSNKSKFLLRAYNEYEIRVFSYRYVGYISKFEVNINWPDHAYRTTKRVIISSESPPGESVQAICSVQLYGECPVGRYGLDCLKDCSQSCQFDKCDTETGYCWLCSEYEKHARCVSPETKLCGKHKYGKLCEKECLNCFGGLCNRSNGQCITDCNSLDDCHEEKPKCPPFKYGTSCKQVCNYCYMGKCDLVTGQCSQGCSVGYFGDYCNQTCSDNCIFRKCEENTKTCTIGCVDDWTGPLCDVRCSSNCAGEGKCYQENRSCIEGCLGGYLDSTCVEQANSKVVYALLIVCTLFSIVIAIICIDEPKAEEETNKADKATPAIGNVQIS